MERHWPIIQHEQHVVSNGRPEEREELGEEGHGRSAGSTLSIGATQRIRVVINPGWIQV